MWLKQTGVWFIQIKSKKISDIGTLFKDWFIQDSGLDRLHCIKRHKNYIDNKSVISETLFVIFFPVC